MKIFGKTLSFDAVATDIQEVKNVTKQTRGEVEVLKRLVQRELTRTNQDVGKWRNYTQIAESVINPNRVEMYRIYKDVVLDAHLTSLMQTIKLKVTSGEFLMCNTDGSENDDATKLMMAPWFRQYLDFYVDSLFYGHSLIQLGGIKDNAFIDVELVPREHVVPETGIVKTNAWSTATDGVPFRDEPFNDWLIECGSKTDLGLLHKATPLVLWKKGVMGAWSHFAELFGMPMRIGKTDILNPTNKKNMESMLKNMASASYAVLNTDDVLELVEKSESDTHKVYDALIDRTNSEMSKLILGQTGTTDEKSFTGSANVHADILGVYITSVKNGVRDHFNSVVLPLMERHGMIKKGLSGKWDMSEKQTMGEKFEITKELLQFYDIPAKWINEEFNIPVEDKPTPDPMKPNPDAQTVIPDVENLYKGIL
jgi:hypothetical protein